MKYPVFASFIILILVIRHAIRRNRRIGEEAENSFWQREHDANEVRRKPLDDLIFVTPDTSSFPMNVLTDDPEIADCRRLVDELKEQMIVNLTGQTNTDLKLRYGVANLPLLTEYDDRYTLLVQTLQKWADRLWENGYTEEAVRIIKDGDWVDYSQTCSFPQATNAPNSSGSMTPAVSQSAILLAPASIAVWIAWIRNSRSARVASTAENSTFSL